MGLHFMALNYIWIFFFVSAFITCSLVTNQLAIAGSRGVGVRNKHFIILRLELLTDLY